MEDIIEARKNIRTQENSELRYKEYKYAIIRNILWCYDTFLQQTELMFTTYSKVIARRRNKTKWIK